MISDEYLARMIDVPSTHGNIDLRIALKELQAYRTVIPKVRGALEDTKALCSLICGSPNTTQIKGNIESIAFILGHHPYVLNPHLLDGLEEDK